MPAQSTYNINQAINKLLPSQRKFVFSPDNFVVAEGGFGCGKTHAALLKALILSIEIPNNRGLIGRYHATDLEDSVIPMFFEVCPASWIRSYRKERNIVTLRNGSEVMFRHVHDEGKKKPGKQSRRVGANLGWFFVDQLEECNVGHWNTLISRLRLPRASKKFGFATANPNGHDWIFQQWFAEQYHPFREREFHQVCRSRAGLGIAVRSDENRVSNGGFVADEDFDNMRSQYPPEWIRRYMDCSFEEFTGKIYGDYYLQSVHNIAPFPVPEDWASAFSIDVGGSAPWAVGIWRIDPYNNLIRTAGFHKPSVNSAEVASFIRTHVKLSDPRTLGIIDYENKLAMLELNQLLRTAIRPAMKAVRPGIIQVGGMMYVNPLLPLPPWYERTQPPDRIKRFMGKGAPQIFVMETPANHPWRHSIDGYVWGDDGRPRKEEDHEADETRYLVTALPKSFRRHAPQTPLEARIAELRRTDPRSAKEAEYIQRRFRRHAEEQNGSDSLAALDEDDFTADHSDRSDGAMVDKQPSTMDDWSDEEDY